MASSSTSSSARSSGDNRAEARLLPSSFYGRDTLEVARDLLGKILVVRAGPGGRPLSARIVETEAYSGKDPASHSCRGPTPRCAVMFGPPGVSYVYFIYGMYEMLNFVTEAKGRAGAVLIRAAEPVWGSEEGMRRRRGGKVRHDRELAAGPGKLCRALGIRMSHNGLGLQGPELQVFDDGCRPAEVSVSPRVGIREGTDKFWRFFIAGNPSVSRAPQNREARPV